MIRQKVLLLNASNMEQFPVFPYAFIQIPAVARARGIEVISRDFLGVPARDWPVVISELISQHDPAMVLVTLRNTDSLNAADYQVKGLHTPAKEPSAAYFPVEQTKDLITAIREVSGLKIALGGFGFSVMPEEYMAYLRPDVGVVGDPDAFFDHFEAVLDGRYGRIANLVYFQDGRIISNPLVYYPPHPEAEYTPEIIQEMVKFYDAFPSPGLDGAPVEIMRGCNHACVFCSEPHVKGKQVRYRDLSAVMADFQILVDHGITHMYIVSSELNPEGNTFILDLSDRIRAFNQRQPADRKVTWFGANYLLTFGSEVHERLLETGFTGGWFDITALDDANARAMKTPYRNRNVVDHLKTYAQMKRDKFNREQTRDKMPPPAGNSGENQNKSLSVSWSLFLGNPATGVGTIRNSMRVANQEGLSQLFTTCTLFKTIRVFAYEGVDQATLDVTYSVTPELARTSYQQILPSFAYPPALLDAFGSGEEISRLFDHLAETYFSTKYRRTRDWLFFLNQHASAESIVNWIAELSGDRGNELLDLRTYVNEGHPTQALERLFIEAQTKEDLSRYAHEAETVVEWLLAAGLDTFPEAFAGWGVPATMEDLGEITPYALAVQVYDRWSTEKELVDFIVEKYQSSLSSSMLDFVEFCTRAVLHRFNLQIDRNYKIFFAAA